MEITESVVSRCIDNDRIIAKMVLTVNELDTVVALVILFLLSASYSLSSYTFIVVNKDCVP